VNFNGLFNLICMSAVKNQRNAHFQVTEQIPEHLRPFIAEQDPSLYTPIDHASWRYILKVSRGLFTEHAHQKYLDGLRETGISTESIPLVEEMDRCLRRFGWRAVAVSGFIPPSVFMEFQSLGILPIACEMRTLDHLAYTPAPDIVHEAAGHAPIIADPEYAAYLRVYGEVSRKAIFSSQDIALYEAVRELSDIKENPSSSSEDIARCQRILDDTVASVHYVSEANLLARMNWWTVEYGLVGSIQDPKIYGAGLLSSLSESYHCLGAEVKKIPMTLDCLNTSYDITRPQPQLFVTPDFSSLTTVLEEFAATMGFRQGGIPGLAKAKMAETVVTAVLDSEIQISGVLSEFLTDSAGEPCYLQFKGPVQLATQDHELGGQGANYHREGYGTPIGGLRGEARPLCGFSDQELADLGTPLRKPGKLVFESGVEVEGVLEQTIRKEGKLLVMSFKSCTVRMGDRILFRPEWGVFDLSCGVEVVSVFGGAADRGKFIAATGGYRQRPRNPKTNLTQSNRALNELYAEVRAIRESKKSGLGESAKRLEEIHILLEQDHSMDWLLRLELLEWMEIHSATLNEAGNAAGNEKGPSMAGTQAAIHASLKRIIATSAAGGNSSVVELINRGLQGLVKS